MKFIREYEHPMFIEAMDSVAVACKATVKSPEFWYRT